MSDGRPRRTCTTCGAVVDAAGGQVSVGEVGAVQRGPGPPGYAPRLRESERRVAVLVAEGLTNRQVAGELFVSLKTVEFHLSAIYRWLGIHNRTELTRLTGRSSG